MNAITKLLSAYEVALAKFGSREFSALVRTNGKGLRINVVDKSCFNHEITIPPSAFNMIIEELTKLDCGNDVGITSVQA